MSSLNEEKLNKFVDTAVADIKGSMVMLMLNMGDRLGLFRALNAGPQTSAELADKAGLQERYVREWASSMACAGYIEYDAGSQRFSLPPEHAEVLVNESSPVFFGGLYEEMPALWEILPPLSRAFREGGGVKIADYHRCWWDGMQRFTGTWFENFLLQQWIPNAGGLQAKLEAGAHIADVGCGRGKALIKLAQAFPKLTAVGYDLSDSNLEGAQKLAAEAGVADRIRFAKHDVTQPMPEKFDLIMTFDAAHDFTDPQAAFRSISNALNPGGHYLLLEFRVADSLEKNIGPIGAMFYAWSVTYCMTTSLAHDGVGLGTCGMHEPAVRAYADQAGFSKVEVVPFDNPFNILFLATK